MLVKRYVQNDPRWASYPLGTEGRTVGSHGCTCTDLCNALANYAVAETPRTVVQKLTAQGGIMPSGDLLWASVERVWPSVTFYWRQYTSLEGPMYANRQNLDAAIARIRKLIRRGQPVLINVDAIGNDRQTDHWILGVDVDADGEVVVDCPWRGDRTRFSVHYRSMREGIYGYTVLIGAPISYVSSSSGGDIDIGSGLFKAAQIWRGRNVATYSKELIDTLL